MAKALTNKILRPARRHSWFWIPMGGIISDRIKGQTAMAIALFYTGAAFIIVPPAITLAILKSAVPPAKPGTDSE